MRKLVLAAMAVTAIIASILFVPVYIFNLALDTYYLGGFILVEVSIFLLTKSRGSGTNPPLKLL